MREFMVLTVVACWLAVIAGAANVATVAPLNVSAETTPPSPAPEPASLQSAVERKARIKAPDGQDRVHALAAASEASEASSTTALKASESDTATAGISESVAPGPVIVLVTGCVVIAAVALAFQKRRAARKNEKDANDPMQQALLFHDMDYAAM